LVILQSLSAGHPAVGANVPEGPSSFEALLERLKFLNISIDDFSRALHAIVVPAKAVSHFQTPVAAFYTMFIARLTVMCFKRLVDIYGYH
jgi:hypothetical protein